ncbi:hypothetical protein KAU45_01170 [bacterium]|nr:hypothetical protein [bacterium]
MKRIVGVLALLLTLSLVAGCGHRARAGDYRDYAYRAARAGLWREALARWEQVHELTPDDPGILNNLAVAHEAQGENLRAKELYEGAVALAPDDEEIRHNLLEFRRAHPELYPEGNEDDE